ncbi:MAG: DUF1570 domain-containing protein [Planctomycetes bacterium]|nr:DUF1570 domain-containing protein [Planctomycetota bacterium]
MKTIQLLSLVGALLTLAPVADAFDRVITHDNRFLECKKVREDGSNYRIEFEHDVVVLAKDKVKAVEISGDMSDYVPKDDDERQKLAQGFIKYKGKWFSKAAYEDELEKEAAASKKRADEIALHSDWENAWVKETKHFVVKSNTSPELLDYYCELMEAYYSLMDERFGIKVSPVLGRTKMDVHVYKNKADFTKYAKPDSPSVLGYFNRGESPPVLTFYHYYAEPAQTEWVALHECTHLLTYLIDPQYYPQIWLNEAVADYFGSSEISRDKKGKLVIKPGAMQSDRLLTVQDAMKDGTDTKLDKLFDIERDDFDGFQYAHAWAFIYFLNESNPKYQKAFNRFFKDLYTQAKGITYETVAVPAQFDKSGTAKQASAKEIRRVVLQALGVKDLNVLEKEWKTWIGNIKLTEPEQLFKRAYTSVAYRGLWVIGTDGRIDREKTKKAAEQALEDLDAALKGGLKDARAHWARHSVLKELDRDEEARAALQAAIDLEPLNARYRWDMGGLLNGGFSMSMGDDEDSSSFTVDGMGRPKDEALKCYGLATELAPDNDVYRRQFEKFKAAK